MKHGQISLFNVPSTKYWIAAFLLFFVAVPSGALASTLRFPQAPARAQLAPAHPAGPPNVFASARGLSLSNADLDRYIASSVVGNDRGLAKKLMAFMPVNQRGDFVHLDPATGRLMSNNPALLRYVKLSFEPQRANQRQQPSTRVDSSEPHRMKHETYFPCSPPDPPSNPHGAYSRQVSPCGFTAGWGFVNVACGAYYYHDFSSERGYLYMELTGSNGSETEGGLQYNSDTSVAPWLNVNGTIITMTNGTTRYGCNQALAIFAGATPGDVGQFFVEVGQLPSGLDPQQEWINSQIITLNNGAWLFTSAPSDVSGLGTDGAGFITPCVSCGIAKTVTLAQNNVQTYSMDGSYFGLSSNGQLNAIAWDQLAFGNWDVDCIPTAQLCTFDVSADPTVYYVGEQVYPGYPQVQSNMSPVGYGPYQSYDGISLSQTFGQQQRGPSGTFTEPLPPMPCSADSDGNCGLIEQSKATSQCNTGLHGIHGQPIYVTAYTQTWAIYSNGTWPNLQETTVATEHVPLNAPCTITTTWSPNEPRTHYNDPNLP